MANNNKNKKPLEFGMNSQNDESKNNNNSKAKNNFTTALKEIFGEKEAPIADETPAKAAEPVKKQPATPQTASKYVRLHPQKALLPQHLHRLLPPLRPPHCTSPTSHLSPLSRPLSPRTPSLRVRSSPNPISKSAAA